MTPGHLAYNMALGVGGLVLGGLMLLGAAWILLVAVLSAALGGGTDVLVTLVLLVVLSAIGAALVVQGRSRLLRL